MIVAIILAERADLKIGGEPAYFLPIGEESVIERVTRTVLRGPFGVTIVVSAPELSVKMKELLSGFAVQHVKAAPQLAVTAALKAADEYRARWQNAMKAAEERFAKTKETSAKKGWEEHRKSGDVKVRGLARSFDRDGVMFCRGNQPGITAEMQARLIEAFAKEGERATIVQPVHAQTRGYPLLLDSTVTADLKLGLDTLLASAPGQIQPVTVENPLALTSIETVVDYNNVREALFRH